MYAVLNHYSIQTPQNSKTKQNNGVHSCKHASVCSLRLSINELPTWLFGLMNFLLNLYQLKSTKMFWTANKVLDRFSSIHESTCTCSLRNARCRESNGWVVVSKLYNGFFSVNCFVNYEYKLRLYWKTAPLDLLVHSPTSALEDINTE